MAQEEPESQHPCGLAPRWSGVPSKFECLTGRYAGCMLPSWQRLPGSGDS